MQHLAFALWPQGEVGRAVSLFADAEARITGLAHVATRAYGSTHAALFELMRGDLAREAPHAIELARLACEHDLRLWRAFGMFLVGVAGAQSSATGGLEDMRRGVELLREQNVLIFDGLIKIALAQAEVRAGDVSRGLAVVEEALTTCERIGFRTFEAELHRVRGEMLLKRDPANPTPAQRALQTAIAVSKQQGTRGFELRAALALAKVYQSADRLADAHAVLAPALEGFLPTSEMPEIAEAQALIERLA
jgi:predicted ATPase